MAGLDETGPHLFATDPSGAFVEYKARSEGTGREGALAFFENKYDEHLPKDEAIILGIQALYKGTKGKLDPDTIEIAIVDTKEKFRKLTFNETKEYVKKAIE